jgi:hypothetical protein
MSILKVDAIRHNSATSDAITMASDGTCTAKITNNLSNRRININGAMQIWQRSISLSVSEGTNEGVTACDRYGFEFGNASAGAATISRSTDVPTNLGFPYSFKIDVTTINNMSATNTQIRMPHRIEAQDIANSGWKYNDPNSFLTISFYFKSNKSGTNKLPLMIRTFDGTAYFYVSEITQSDTNWNRHTIKVPGNSNLTFNKDSGMGLSIEWYFAVGSTYHTTPDTWGTVQKHGTSSSTNYFDSTSNEMFITGIQIESTTNGIATDFEYKSEQDELLRCYRYYYKMGKLDYKDTHMSAGETYGIGMSDNDNTNIYCQIDFPVPMREPPSTLDQAGASNYYVRRDTTQTCTGNPSLTNGSEFSFRVNFPKSSHGWGTGQMLWCQSAGSGSYLGFDAEI